MKVASYDIVFQEIPREVTLALNISQCPCHCPNCHSPHLAEDIGEVLTEDLLNGLLARYGAGITCICLMGGDAFPQEINYWLWRIHTMGKKAAWYSGREQKAPEVELHNLDFLKLGPYKEECGALKHPTTNQRLYRIRPSSESAKKSEAENEPNDSTSLPSIEEYIWEDITSTFWR